MAAALKTRSRPYATFAEIQEHVPGVPASRIRLVPAPGTATVEDLLRAESRFGVLCELVDGILVEKAVAWEESCLAMMLGHILLGYLEAHPLGAVSGEQGMMRTIRRRVRMPDVAFIRWSRIPPGATAPDAICSVAPDLAVEILSKKNTRKEMKHKLREYFKAGTMLVWYIDPRKRSAELFTSPTDRKDIDENGFLSGGKLLPGFKLRLGELFERAEQMRKPPKPTGGKTSRQNGRGK
jgi:Uma2 family endonuclease